MATTLVIGDPHAILREGLGIQLARSGEIEVRGEAAEAEALYRALERQRPDVALVALDLPAPSPAELIARVAALSRCVVIAPADSRVQLEGALEAGALGYVLASDGFDELIAAILRIKAGRTFVSRSASHHLVEVMHGSRGAGRAGFDLTLREREVLSGIAMGQSSRDLAGELGISIRTVERHRASMMSKLDIHKTAKLVRFAVREGIVAA